MTPLKESRALFLTSPECEEMEEDAYTGQINSHSSYRSDAFPADNRAPKSRRLFTEFLASEEDDDQGCHLDHHHVLTRSPPRQRRAGLRPLDLNHDFRPDGERFPLAEKRTQNTQERTSQSGAADAMPPALMLTRKRSTADRREKTMPLRRLASSGSGSGESELLSLSSSSSSPDPNAMHTSPKLSPNSFLTIDGRFVHSKNPFSSPMMTEPPPAAVARKNQNGIAPSLPIFPSTAAGGVDTKGPGGFLSLRPLRTHSGDEEMEMSTGGDPLVERDLNGGFPDRRFCFTGSPIPESSSPPGDDMMETDIASGGSFHKIRRLNRSDDVVIASEHKLTARLRQLVVDTQSSSLSSSCSSDFSEEISPTEVMSFQPPPTPIKARPSKHAYTSIRCQEPPTPIRETRLLPANTPHPGSMTLHQYSHHPPASASKSRFYGDFDIIGELGKGSFGTVFKVLSRLDGCMYAIKAAQRKAKGTADRDRMLKEVYALASLADHADTGTFHIVRYHQAWMEDDRLYIQMELCTSTLTAEVLREGGCLPDHRCYKLLREILLALDLIHRHNMVHLDVKPDNIFLKNDQFKLGDFGLVSQASSYQDVEEGDSRYMSKELLQGDRTDLTKSDIFSFGISMYEIRLRQPLPMNGPEWQDLRNGCLSLMPNTPADMSAMIFRMMDPSPTNRPTAKELLRHPQLLSEEEKALLVERSKVAQANLELAAQAQRLNKLPPPPMRKSLMRANTWNGSSFPHS